jgi:hypothetical protein
MCADEAVRLVAAVPVTYPLPAAWRFVVVVAHCVSISKGIFCVKVLFC